MKKVLIVVLLIVLGSCLFAQDYVIGDHDLLFMPTAKTIPKGTSYFSDYELVFLNYSFGVTDRTTISAYSLFPITDSFTETFTLSVKQNYYQYKNVNSAFWFTYIFDNPFYAIGNVVSLDAKGTSLHIGLAGLGEEFTDDMGFLYMLGLKTKLGKKPIL